MEPDKKSESKGALRDKNRISAKQFVKLKRGKMLEEKSNFQSFEAIRSSIISANEKQFQSSLFSNKPQSLLTFLFSENELKQTPLMQIIASNNCCNLLKALNSWSNKQQDLIIREVYMQHNELRSSEFIIKFQNLNKSILQTFDKLITLGESIELHIELLGFKNSIFYHLSKNYLSLEMIISSLSNLKIKNNLLSLFYCQLLAKTNLKELAQLRVQVSGFQSILLRDKMWGKMESGVIKSITIQGLPLLTLKELNYNVWHQLANNPPQFIKTCNLLLAKTIPQQIQQYLYSIMAEVDSSGEIPLDRCLRQWKHKEIRQIFKLSPQIQNIILSTNCINYLFYNRHLNQKERQDLINQCLQGQIAQKGYANIMVKQQQKQLKGKKQQYRSLKILPVKFTYNLCYDSVIVKKQKDKVGNFPLLTYLHRYKTTANLAIVQKLFVQTFNKKYIKKQLSLLIKNTEGRIIKMENNTAKLNQIEEIFDYYQPLWKVATYLPHGDVLQYLLSKFHINCFEIKLTKLSHQTEIEPFGNHFIAYYVRNNPSLAEDPINKQLLESILQCKANQKTIGQCNLDLELMRSLMEVPGFLKSQEYLIVGLRKHLKQLFQKMSSEDLLKSYIHWGGIRLLDIIARPLKNKQPSFMTEKDIIEKIPYRQLLQTNYTDNVSLYHGVSGYCSQLIYDNAPQVQSDQKTNLLQRLSIKNLFGLQDCYNHSYKPRFKNKQFFDCLKDYLFSVTNIEFAGESKKLKFYCFRLRTKEKYIVYKMKRLLSLGIDPYFSKYSKQIPQIQEQNSKWSVVIKRMIRQKCTFICALVTEPSVIFEDFKEIFESCFANVQTWIKWSLMFKVKNLFYKYTKNLKFDSRGRQRIYRIQINDQMFHVDHRRRSCNYQFIMDLLKFALLNGLEELQFIRTMLIYFKINLDQLSYQISQQQKLLVIEKQEKNKKKITADIQTGKNNIANFIGRTLSIIIKEVNSSQQRLTQAKKQVNIQMQLFQDFYFSIIQSANCLNQEYILKPLFKYKELKDINVRYHILKLKHSQNRQQMLYSYMKSLDKVQLRQWIKNIQILSKHQLVQLTKTLSFQSKKQLLTFLISSETKIIEQDDSLVKIILQSIESEQIIETLSVISFNQFQRQKYKKLLLRSAQNKQKAILALIILLFSRPNDHYYFYLQHEGKIRRFNTHNFYSKCHDSEFQTYLTLLQKYHEKSSNIGIHLKTVVTGLIESETWPRLQLLLSVKILQSHTVRIILRGIFTSNNRSADKNHPQVKAMVPQLLQYCQSQHKEQFDEDLFDAVFFLDFQKAFSIFKPNKLSLYSFKKCISTHPQSATLIIASKIFLNKGYIPPQMMLIENPPFKLRNWFPMIQHNAVSLSKNTWLIDEIRVQLSLLKQLNGVKFIYKSLESFCTYEQALAHKNELFSGQISDLEICQHILRSNSISSISKYEKYIPEMSKLTSQIVMSCPSKKGSCVNLNSMNVGVVKELISNKIISSTERNTLRCCFLRVLDTANLELIDLFAKTNNLVLNYDFFNEEPNFWDRLLAICNEQFLISFITKYNMLEIFPSEQYSQKLLNTICRFRWNKILNFTISYFQKKAGKVMFAAQTFQNKPSISPNGVFYLPIELSIENNFYEIYFLIQSSHNECPKFRVSGRFLSFSNPTQWEYLPEFKRRVDINNTLMDSLRQAQEMTFRFQVLLPSIFQLQKATKAVADQQQMHPMDAKIARKGYSESLCSFILDLTRKQLRLTPSSGSFEKLCFMIFKKNVTKIPEVELEKRYPSQMKIIAKLRRFMDDQEVTISLAQLFDYVPEYKPLLLLYNPKEFLTHPEYMREMTGEGESKLDFSQYLKGVQINFIEFEESHMEVLEKYIVHYFFECSVGLGDAKESHHLTRQALLLILLQVAHFQRQWPLCPIFNLCKGNMWTPQPQLQSQRAPEYFKYEQEMLYKLAMRLNVRLKGEMSFDLMTWNKIVSEIVEVEGYWLELKKPGLKEWNLSAQEKERMIRNYCEIVAGKMQQYKMANLQGVLREIYDQHLQNNNRKGVFIELSLLLNAFLLHNDIHSLHQKVQTIKGGAQVQTYKITLVKNITHGISFESQTELALEVQYSMQQHSSKQLSLLLIDYNSTVGELETSLYLSNLKHNPELTQLNEFCLLPERQSFLKGYKFRYDVTSFQNVKYDSLTAMLEFGAMQKDGVVGRVMGEIERMEEKLVGTKNVKLYTPSDIYGPINFAEEKDEAKIIDCLGFYELIDLPKDPVITVVYREGVVSKQERNDLSLRQVKNYCRYYREVSLEEGEKEVEVGWEMVVGVRGGKVEVEWGRLGAWTVCQAYCLLLGFCSDLSSKIEKVLDVRVSFLSLVDYYENYLRLGEEGLRVALERLLFGRAFSGLVENLIMMITEDVGNIMKIVKGIVVKWSINRPSARKKGDVAILDFLSATSVDYQVADQLLNLTINLRMEPKLNIGRKPEEREDYSSLVDRKEFLDSVFTSAQFLTDYFLVRNDLNNCCLTVSRSVSSRLNSTVNFHIDYGSLYKFVERMRATRSIKDIESYLLRLKQHLTSNIDKAVTLYLASPLLANSHQVFLLNKCEALHRERPLGEVQGEKQLEFESSEGEGAGLEESRWLMEQVGNEECLRNAFLIQIFKSYYSTMVGEGMTFVVGYKGGKKRAEVVRVTKAESINLINVVEVEFILLVSKNIPTADEINSSKIIRLFLTDSNKNLYRLNDKLKQYFLALPEESEERALAGFAPIVASNIKLSFALNGEREADTRDTKIFFIDLDDSAKFKLQPLPDRPLTPVDCCKKSSEFKETVGELRKALRNFTPRSMRIIVDLPPQFTQIYAGVNFPHVVHLLSTDIQQFLLKAEQEPMRNPALDCKLSAQHAFPLNKNSLIQLRKQTILKHFSAFRIRICDGAAGIVFSKGEVVVNINTASMSSLPSASEYLSVIVEQVLTKEKVSLPKYVSFAETSEHESTEVLLKELDLISCLPHQVEEMQRALALIRLLFNKEIAGFKVIIQRKKSEVKFAETLELHLNLETVDREFFSCEQLVQTYITFTHKEFQPNAKGQTYFNPLSKTILVEETSASKFKLIYQLPNLSWKVVEAASVGEGSKMVIPFEGQPVLASRYYLLQQLNIYSNYFFKVEAMGGMREKNEEGTRGKDRLLYLHSPKEINLNFTTISVVETDPMSKESSSPTNVLQHHSEKNRITVRLLCKNTYCLAFNYQESKVLAINYAGNSHLLNPEVDSTRLVVSSDGALCLDRTRFVELEAYKKKPVLIKEREQEGGNEEFRESSEVVGEEELEGRLGDPANIENLVYVVNEECRKYLTRAGEPRVDYIQLCDPDGYALDYRGRVEVLFVHVNRLAAIRPEVVPRGTQLALRWTPSFRGHYYLYVNRVRLSPPYEVGVSAGQADCGASRVTLPKVKKICYCEETELMLDLRDHFGNLYTQLEEDIIGDSLLIELRCSRLGDSLKVEKSQMNKYGVKKVRFSFNSPDALEISEVEVEVFMNLEPIARFTLAVEGLSLKQRKKRLDADISLANKNYYKDISVNRGRFLEELFVIAEKSLHTNLSVRFHNEPGIDAGGVKREFYDMVGNEMKSDRNPFFRPVGPHAVEYFLNPDLLRNKKKLEYMELWGKYVANALLNSYLLGLSFSPVFVKLLYEQATDFDDLLAVLPPDEKKQYEYLLTASPADFDDLDLYFTVVLDKKKCVEAELKEGGRQLQVTADNVREYLQCTAQALLTERYRQVMVAFRKGFDTVLEVGLFKKWIRSSEFWCLTAGNKEITPELVLNYVVFQGNNIDNISGWFRRFITEATHEVLVGFLKFSSGSSSIDFSLTSKVTVTFENAGDNPKKLPISHTCWKEIVVPKYKNYDIMKKLLTAAFIYCSEGFGFG